jgi:acyl-coenzyme A thioesterase PaaI-like protein
MEADGTGVDTAAHTAPDVGPGRLLDDLVELGETLPFNQRLGVRVRHLRVGRAETELPADERLANHLGGVHAIAELAPVELAGALAASSRLHGLVSAGYVPVVAGITVRYRAPAVGRLVAVAEVGEEAVDPAWEAVGQGRRPRLEVDVEVYDEQDVVVLRATCEFVYLGAEGA